MSEKDFYAQVPERVLHATAKHPQAVRVYCRLHRLRQMHDEPFYQSASELAEALGLATKTVRRALDFLVRERFVVMRSRVEEKGGEEEGDGARRFRYAEAGERPNAAAHFWLPPISREEGGMDTEVHGGMDTGDQGAYPRMGMGAWTQKSNKGRGSNGEVERRGTTPSRRKSAATSVTIRLPDGLPRTVPFFMDPADFAASYGLALDVLVPLLAEQLECAPNLVNVRAAMQGVRVVDIASSSASQVTDDKSADDDEPPGRCVEFDESGDCIGWLDYATGLIVPMTADGRG